MTQPERKFPWVPSAILFCIFAGIFLFLVGLENNPRLSNTPATTSRQSQGSDQSVFASPPANSLISDDPLPEKVFEAQKKKIRIIGQFYINGHQNNNPEIIVGSGFAVNYKSKTIILSARHILVEPIFDSRKGLFSFNINSYGIPEGLNYSYKYFGIVNTENSQNIFPIVPLAMGELGQHQDYVAFKADQTVKLSPLTLNKDANVNEDAYVSGFGPMLTGFPNRFGGYETDVSDVIDYTFKGKIAAKIQNLPINQHGVKKLYRIRVSIEQGFSGGPVFNNEGEVIGMIIEGIRNFHSAVSSEDLLDFLERIYARF